MTLKSNIHSCSNDSKNIDVTLGALLEAIKTDDEEMAELIIKNGFNVNITDRFGKTALHYAAFKGWCKTIVDIFMKEIYIWY